MDWYVSPGHAIREPVRLNEAQREAVGKVDPYTKHRLYEETLSVAVVDHYAGNQAARLRNIAALRRELDDGSRMKAFPQEGRSCLVYRSNDR